MKSTVIIFALAIVLLAGIANHGCESAAAAVPLKMAAEDRITAGLCASLQGKCDGLVAPNILHIHIHILKALCNQAMAMLKATPIC